MKIIGAGLSGLICGALNAQAEIFERNDSDVVNHKALLRFRDDKIARALGLSFRKVTVRKGIWYQGQEVQPTPRLANFYSLKVRASIGDASIWNLAPSERFIAPEDLHGILADICGNRINWGFTITAPVLDEIKGPIVSTIPLVSMLKILGIPSPLEFRYAPIYVDRFFIANCDVYQTMYFPARECQAYRATITGKLLTIESVSKTSEWELRQVLEAFGIEGAELEPLEANHKQLYGKISPVNEQERKAILYQLTREYGIYSLGRFATWRNILLDDVYDDIAMIRRMMTQSHYDTAKGMLQ